MVLGQLKVHLGKKLNLDLNLTPRRKVHSKWIIDLNVRAKTVNFRTKQGPCDLAFGSDYLEIAPKAQG